jgi:hypothetical protein
MDPYAPMRKRPEPRPDRIMERLRARLQPTPSGCLEWTGPRNREGYGQMFWRGRSRSVHRVAWTVLRGEIPEDMTLDHLCRNTSCANVDHLEIVTRAENTRRGTGRHVSAAHSRARTHCKYGHQFVPANTLRDKNGWRHCRTCAREYQLRIRDARNARRRLTRAAQRRTEQEPCG